MLVSRIGPYRIVRKLGEGGMGSVYEGVKDDSERRFAIKVLRTEYARSETFITHFFHEARLINQVEHPGLVHIADSAQLADGTAYIGTELLRGEPLGNRIKRSAGPMGVPHVLAIACQLGAALAAAHEKGIVHRDLFPPRRGSAVRFRARFQAAVSVARRWN